VPVGSWTKTVATTPDSAICVIEPNYREGSALHTDSGHRRRRHRTHGRRVHLAQQGRISEPNNIDDRPDPVTDGSSFRQQGPGVRRVQGDFRRSRSSNPVTDWRLSAE
jgi:hypothetical protein